MSQAAQSPTLPQNDTAAAQNQRAAQLTKTCESYAWTTTVSTLQGVPLLAKLPFSETPTIPWLGLVVEVALEIARNLFAVKLSDAYKSAAPPPAAEPSSGGPSTEPIFPPEADADMAAVTHDMARCDEIERSLAEIIKPPAPPKPAVLPQPSLFAEVRADVSHFKSALVADIDKVVVGAEDVDQAAKLRSTLEELRAMVAKHTADVGRRLSQRAGTAGAADLSAYEALFNKLPLPAIASTMFEDSTFARLRVAGPNPMLLTGIDKIPDHFGVSAEDYRKVMGDGDSLDRALGEGRVYLLDYAELEALTPGTTQGVAKFPYAPMALFAVPVGGSSLKPVAIQCGQDRRQPIFTPSSDSAAQWGWQMAKTVVQVAECSYHELYVHLARTHLVMEAFAVATRRCLAEVHPVWALLVPHFEGSLFINDAAARVLIDAGSPIDTIFAGTIASSQVTSVNDRLRFDFYGKIPPVDLAARKVADAAKLPDYPYRDDALLVWQAIRAWAEQYIGIYYATDAAVTGDYELAAWVASVASDGKIKGFKPITTREQLVDVCAMIMFTASAQHAAVNFPQKELMSYAPAITGAGWTAAPTSESDHTKPEWLGYMPSVSIALEQLNTLYLLGSVYYRMLGDYRSNSFPYPPWFRDPAVTGSALPSFQSALTAVENRIAARNRERLAPYTYLLPSLIPTSINI